MKDHEIKKMVRESYASMAEKKGSCCPPTSGCCDGQTTQTISRKVGYTDEQLAAIPIEADMGLGCGNPIRHAGLKPGEVILDLGSGAGIDCFLAAREVGATGRVVGVDMTPEMIDKARRAAQKGKYDNVEFRLGEIDNLPAGDDTVDVIVSNCVINLAPDKGKVFREAFRVLKPGGRFVVSDMVLTSELPVGIRSSVEAYAGCIAGAMLKDQYLETIRQAGFQRIEILTTTAFSGDIVQNDPTEQKIIVESNISTEKVDQFLAHVESITVAGYKT